MQSDQMQAQQRLALETANDAQELQEMTLCVIALSGTFFPEKEHQQGPSRDEALQGLNCGSLPCFVVLDRASCVGLSHARLFLVCSRA
jgi:hypothetical protein